jgi:hypothetical protein
MEAEKLLTTNDYQDIENQLKENKKNVKTPNFLHYFIPSKILVINLQQE